MACDRLAVSLAGLCCAGADGLRVMLAGQMKEADKGRTGKRKGRGDAVDDADALQDMSRKFYKKKY